MVQPVLTSGQLDSLRHNRYYATQYISVSDNPVIFAASVNQASFDDVFAQVTFDTVTTGAYTDIEAGMTVYIGATSDIRKARFVGRVRKSATSSILYINETRARIHDNDIIQVINDYRLWSIWGRESSGTEYVDWDLTFESLRPGITGLPQAVAGFVASGTGKLRRSFTASPYVATKSATIASYQWTLPSGVTLVSGSLTSATVEIDADPGEYWIKLDVTDSGGRATTRRIKIFAHDTGDEATFPVPQDFSGAEIVRDLNAGHSASVSAWDGVDTVADETLCVIWHEPVYDSAGALLYDGVELVGRFSQDSSGAAGDPLYSTLPDDAQFTIAGIDQQLSALNAPRIAIRNSALPDAWGEIEPPTVWRSILHILDRYTTLTSIADVGFDNTGETFVHPSPFSVSTGDILASINSIAAGINAAAQSGIDGSLEIVRKANYQSDSARDALDVAATWQEQDTLRVNIRHRHGKRVGYIEAVGAAWRSASADVLVVGSFVEASGSEESRMPADQVLTTDSSKNAAQTELNARIGYHVAVEEVDITLEAEMPDGYGAVLCPAWNVWHKWILTANSNNRGWTYDANTRWLLSSVRIAHDNETGTRAITGLIWTPEALPDAIGIAGQTLVLPTPTVLQPIVPTFPSFDVFPGFPELPSLTWPDPAPIVTESPIASPAPSNDGNTVVVWSSSRLWLTNKANTVITNTPFAEITPAITDDEALVQFRWGLGTRGYLLTYDSANDRSRVWTTANAAVENPEWSAGAWVDGEYTQVEPTSSSGQIYLRADTDDSAWCHTFQFDTASGADPDTTYGQDGWVVAPGLTGVGTYSSGVGWEDTDAEVGAGTDYRRGVDIERTFSAATITSIEVTYEYTKGTFTTSSGNAFRIVIDDVTVETIIAGDISSGTPRVDNWAGSESGCTQIGVRIFSSQRETASYNGNVTVTKVVVCGSGINPFAASADSAVTRYSDDHGATFAAAVTIGDAVSGGIDAIQIGVPVLAAAAGEVGIATTAGGSYSTYTTLPALATPRCILVPRYKFDDSSNAATSTPDFILISSLLTASDEAVWQVSASGATLTDITPNYVSDYGVAVSPNCAWVAWSNADLLACILSFNGSRRLYTYNGTGWNDAQAVGDSADYVRGRKTDADALYWIDGTWYTSDNFGDTATERSYPADPDEEPLIGVEPYG